MDKYEIVKEIFQNQSGIAHTSDITSHGIHSDYMDILCQKSIISKIKRGVYEWVEDGSMDDLEIIFKLFPDCVICMHSALSYYDYIDRTPDSWHLAFNRDVNKKSLKINYPPINPYFFEPHILDLGITKEVMNGRTVRIYDRERILCDVLRYSNKIDKELMNKAIQSYLNDNSRDIRRLISYAKQLRVYKKVQQWLGVWL